MCAYVGINTRLDVYMCTVVDTWDDPHPLAGKGSSFPAQWEQLACPDTSQGGPWLTNKGTNPAL